MFNILGYIYTLAVSAGSKLLNSNYTLLDIVFVVGYFVWAQLLSFQPKGIFIIIIIIIIIGIGIAMILDVVGYYIWALLSVIVIVVVGYYVLAQHPYSIICFSRNNMYGLTSISLYSSLAFLHNLFKVIKLLKKYY